MDGYATLNSQQFETALTRAIAVLGAWVAEEEARIEAEKAAKIAEIWAKRTWYFGPWSLSGAEDRYWDWLGINRQGWKLSQRKELLKNYQTQLLRIDVMNAEPYMLKLDDFNALMSWQK